MRELECSRALLTMAFISGAERQMSPCLHSSYRMTVFGNFLTFTFHKVGIDAFKM